MTIQQKLANRIYELLPNKKELEFGTAWEDKQAKWVYVAYFSITTSQKGGWTSVNPDKEQIIGQPLRLADVLFIFEKLLSEAGVFTKEPYFQSFNEIISRYKLSKDNILDQSDEFCEFVYELIK
jgi:hypothetical protein